MPRNTTLLTVGLWCCVSHGQVAASKPRLRLERIDTSACTTSGTLVAHVTEVDIDGTLPRRPLSEYRLIDQGNRSLAKRPSHAATFAETKGPLRIALVVERGPAYEANFSRIKSALTDFIRGLPDRGRYTLIAYDHETRRLLHRGTADQMLDALARLGVTGSVIDPALLAALQMGLDALSDAPKPTRKLLVVLSDGIDRLPDWDQFRNLGRRAERLSVAVFPVGFSPIDERGPLLNLGEIAKRSRGTFRWAQQAEQIPKSLSQLARELNEQRVLSFAVKRCAVRGVQVAAGGLSSNLLPVSTKQSSRRGADQPARGVLWWVAVILGVLAVMALLVLAVRFLFAGVGQPGGRDR